MDLNHLIQLTDNEEELSKFKISLVRSDDCRILFSSNLHDTSVEHNKLRYLLRGNIIDSLDNTILAIPSKSHSYIENINKTKFKDIYNQGLYDIIEVKDGTNITLYNFNGTLCMGTNRSIDITKSYWSGDKTFGEMFYESAKSNPNFIRDTNLCYTESGTLSWNLPIQYSVTIGFRHHDIHQNTKDPHDVWLVRCVNIDTQLNESIPQLSSLSVNTYISNNPSYEDLLSKTKRDIYEDQEEKFYGYLLSYKGSEEIPIEFERVFIPSKLYKILQFFFYSFSKKPEDILDHSNRYTFSIVKNILSNNVDGLNSLCRINLKYKNYINAYKSFIESLCLFIVNKWNDDTPNSKSKEYNNFADNIIKEIKQMETDIDKNDTSLIIKLVNDFTRDPENSFKITKLIHQD